MKLIKSLCLALGLVLWTGTSHAAALTACGSGVTNCSNDTTNAALIAAAIGDPITQTRVQNLWNQQCVSIFSEAANTAGHSYRNNFCLSIAAGRVPPALLVSSVMNSTVVSEVLAGSQPSPCNGCGNAAGNMVDADVNTAIDTALTVTGGPYGTSSFAPVSTTATQSTVGSDVLTVASGTGIAAGDSVYASGVPAGTTVAYITSTTVYLSAGITAALSSTPVVFIKLQAGLPTRAWQ